MKQLSDVVTNTHGCDMLQSVYVGKTCGIFVTTECWIVTCIFIVFMKLLEGVTHTPSALFLGLVIVYKRNKSIVLYIRKRKLWMVSWICMIWERVCSNNVVFDVSSAPSSCWLVLFSIGSLLTLGYFRVWCFVLGCLLVGSFFELIMVALSLYLSTI
jgi:hypothetical protein